MEADSRFGRLVALAFFDRSIKPRVARWLFRCDCGTEKVIRVDHVSRGAIVSCGCHKREMATKHGLHGTPEYYVWAAMLERCRNPNSTNYANYGARGISVCVEWSDFQIFIKDMGERPSNKYSLERVDNDGPYSKANCRWATKEEQARNTRRNRKINYNGQLVTFAEAARMAGIDPSTMWHRINSGWDAPRAIETPPTQ